MSSSIHATAPRPFSASATPALATRMAALSGEGALDVFIRARALEQSGRPVAHLELGEPDFPTPPHVLEAGIAALRDGATRYSAPAGLPELRAAVAVDLTAHGIPADAEQILITPGAKTMLFYAALATIRPGDDVLVPDPGFPIYPSVTRFCGGTPVPYGLVESDGFAPDVDEIAARLTPRTRVLFLNAPHNPTGGGADRAVLERLAELAEAHDFMVISDEVYAHITYDGAPRAPSIAGLPGLGPRTIVVDGFSKRFAMTGWRLGFGLLPHAIVERATTLAVNGHTCTPAFVQRAGVAALRGPESARRNMIPEYRRRRDRVVAGLEAIDDVHCATPRGAFYAFPSVAPVLARAGCTTEQFAERLLEEHGVATLAGTAFGAGGAGHLRLSFAASDETIDRALAGIRDATESLAATTGAHP